MPACTHIEAGFPIDRAHAFGTGRLPWGGSEHTPAFSGNKDRFEREVQVRESRYLPFERSSDELSLTDRVRGHGRPTS
jgi:hypothetical protein